MENELFKAIKSIDIKNLNTQDKEELLGIFQITKNSLIRDRIALIFADLNYNEAVPYIIKKATDKNLIGNNGTLIFSLEDLDTKKYFITFIKIICEQDYEARLLAYNIVEKYADSIEKSIKKKALKILQERRIEEQQTEESEYNDSVLHFINATEALLTS